MRYVAVLMLGVILLGGLSTSQSAASSAVATTSNVSIQNFFFSPQTLTIAVGTTVTWTNDTDKTTPTNHTVTADDSSFDSKTLTPGHSFSFTFNSPGTYNYHCNIHPFMHGSIVVQATPIEQIFLPFIAKN